eukprot:6213472-Pleurochrysis_carterae.AAC.1
MPGAAYANAGFVGGAQREVFRSIYQHGDCKAALGCFYSRPAVAAPSKHPLCSPLPPQLAAQSTQAHAIRRRYAQYPHRACGAHMSHSAAIVRRHQTEGSSVRVRELSMVARRSSSTTAPNVVVTSDGGIRVNSKPLRMSPSSISLFKKCPLQFKYRHIDKLPEPTTEA